jgi:hypothetical protein
MTLDVEHHWRELVSVALLGTDRRDPPELGGPIGDLIADAVRPSPAERILADVAASTSVRRAAFLPAAPILALAAPDLDGRPTCVPAAVQRWHHIVSSWPVLEDEWMVTLIERGWRTDPQLVPAMLSRHRRDPLRRARVIVAAGPLAEWLVEHGAALGPTDTSRRASVDAEQIMTVPVLPIPPELAALCSQPGDEIGSALVDALVDGSLGVAHRAVLVNLLARARVDSLPGITSALDALDPAAPNFGLGASLADLARTRWVMLDELSNTH